MLFQLDLLQSYFEARPSRFARTRQIVKSYKYAKQDSKKAKQAHKLLLLSRDAAREKIQVLGRVVFERKYHALEQHLIKAAVKALRKLKSKSKLADKEFEELVQSKDQGLLFDNVRHKLVKTLYKSYPELKDNDNKDIVKPEWFPTLEQLKSQNPYKTNSKAVNDLFSKVFADKEVKKVLEIEGFEIVWKRRDNNVDEQGEVEDEDVAGSESESESKSESEDEVEGSGAGNDDDDELFDMYKDVIAASSDEEEEEQMELDPEIDYNQVTDEEPSDDEPSDEDDDELSKKHALSDDGSANESQPKKQKQQALPQLATGYYSGGESDDSDDPDAYESDKETKKRKNRRGQRARQKIWEMKYGSTAKHIEANRLRQNSDRERLQQEYEARKAKRAQRNAYLAEKQAKLDAQKKQQEQREAKLGINHPSWEAKILAEKKLKNIKFQGKKMTFD